jgi:hypothetical protein
MFQGAWQESHYWLAAGSTIFQFLGIGVLLWVFGGLVRWSLRKVQPQVQYAAALGLLLATAAVPVGLFVAALDSSGVLIAQHDRAASGLSLPTNGKLRRGPAQKLAGTFPGHEPRFREIVSVGPAPRPGSIDWQALVTSGWNGVRDFSCRWLPWLWLLGTPLMLAVLACGVTGAGRLRRVGRLLHAGDVFAAGQRLLAALRVGRQVTIVICDKVAAPLLVGIVRPAILLPPAVLAGCSPEQIEMILMHELAHVRRWDNLVNLAQRVIEAALFFHPVVWWLSSWVRLEREECCDQVVIAHTGRPQTYAETLAALALPGIAPRHAAAAMADSHLVTRIRHILKLEDESMNVSRKVFVAACGLAIFAGCFAASWAQQPYGTAPQTVGRPPLPGPANSRDGAGTFSNDPLAAQAELLRAIKAGYIQAACSQPVGQITYSLAQDERGWEAAQFQANPLSATQLGSRYRVLPAPRKWGPEQATGAPDSPDHPHNPGNAWCPATADGQEEWLELTYGEPVEPLVLVVYECLKPGALTRVVAFDAAGNELNAWSGKDPSPPRQRQRKRDFRRSAEAQEDQDHSPAAVLRFAAHRGLE